ncbi:hypothetical protein ACFDR9_000464 [Janthinobacterium sp. CG_23.3]|uniref:hypothetical protein n=1 Tax=Janthinobacterium sp. CG_23.3 TaxID=3349634 RepID=UPI0038D39787
MANQLFGQADAYLHIGFGVRAPKTKKTGGVKPGPDRWRSTRTYASGFLLRRQS